MGSKIAAGVRSVTWEDLIIAGLTESGLSIEYARLVVATAELKHPGHKDLVVTPEKEQEYLSMVKSFVPHIPGNN